MHTEIYTERALNSTHPLVSVLMTAYNREKYIVDAIESVLFSTYVNLELIIVDDGSNDDTVKIARSYAAKDERVKVFVNETNLGDYANRNRAASYASGKYLKYVDSDDYIYPWGLAIMVNSMELFPSAGWGLCSLDQTIEIPFPFELSPKEIYDFHYSGNGIFDRAPLSAIIKKKVFDEEKGFKNIRMAGDNEMWHRLGQKNNLVLMPKGIVWYRYHAEQEMKDFEKYLKVYEQIKLSYLRDTNCPLDKQATIKIIRTGKKRMLKQLIKNLVTFRFKKSVYNLNCLMM